MRARYSIFGLPPALVLVVMLALTLQRVPETEGQRQKPEPKPMLMGSGRPAVADDLPKGPATYWVTFSTRIRPGMRLPVTVRLVKPGVTSQVSVSLRNGSDHSISFASSPETTVKSEDGSHIIHLEIPPHLERPNYRTMKRYVLHVAATGDVTFNDTQSMTFDSKYFSVFLQTDKAKYKPGQTVKFRVLAMSPNLTILHEPMDIFVRDPQGNAMKMWKQVPGYKNTGVVEKKIPTSVEASLGDWEIEVTIRNQTETKKFTIEEYVLPKFEAILDMPKVVLLSDNAVRGKACAKYTFGKPLTKAEVKVTVKNSYFYSGNGLTEPVLEKSGRVNKEGELPFVFYKAEFMYLYKNINKGNKHRNVTENELNYQRFNVHLSVKDLQSGKTMETEGTVSFIDQVAKIETLPITPKTYKPGLKFTAMFKVTKFDGTLFEDYKKKTVTFNITATYQIAYNETTTTTTTTAAAPSLTGDKVKEANGKRRPIPDDYPWTQQYRYMREDMGVVSKPLTANGYMTVDVDVPFNATNIQIVASILGQTQEVNAGQSASPSGSFLQIQAQENSPKAGHKTSVHVKTTEPVEKLIYQLYAKGELKEEAEATAVDSDRRLFNVDFEVTANMAPNCRVLAFYIRDDAEVVADSLLIKIDTSEQTHVNVSYSKQTVKPGETVDMKVTSRPNSTVFLLSVDKSVKLLKSGNDITQDMVDQELLHYSYGSGFGHFWPLMRMCGWPWAPYSVDAYGVFNEANVGVITDGTVYRKPRERKPRINFKSDDSHGIAEASQALSKSSEKSAVESVRKLFPETWLFDAVFIGSDGEMLMPQTSPDTITTWMTTAFAVHPHYGLSVLPQAAELTTFRPMFVNLDLPYSAIRGEDLCMKAFAFNYLDKPAYMRLTLGRNEGFANIRLKHTRGKIREYRASEKVTHYVGKVMKGEMVETTFCFTPTSLGPLAIRVNLTAINHVGDGVERILMVEPEGIPRVQATPVILDVSTQESFKEEVAIKFPDNTVEGSQRITVAIAADLLGPVFDNIEDLLRMPYGCGEQNMLYFAPNVFLIEYLKKTDTYTTEVSEKAENYMLTGYQKQLKYKHDDGSYSTFGQRPNITGSMWLTAFVTKCFAQSLTLGGDVICVDTSLIRESMRWMISQQAKNGSFPEPGKVFNKNMQGGSAQGEALTAYVLIAIAEATRPMHMNATDEEMEIVKSVVKKAQDYLEKSLTSLTDPYDLAIVTYALHLTNSNKADYAFNKLMEKSISKHLTTHWERPTKKKKQYWYWQRQTDAINIEMTGYALLTLLHRQDMTRAMGVVRWMTQQRGPQGGFISTQDTVIGLQGLAQIAVEIYQPTFTPVNVSVTWSTKMATKERTVTLDDRNKLLLHKIELPIDEKDIPTTVTIKATAPDVGNFSGMAVAEVIQDYTVSDVQNPEDSPAAVYSLKTWVENISVRKSLVTVQASRVDGEEGSMTVIEVSMPTGYVVDQEDSFYSVNDTRMVEMKVKKTAERTFVLYYDMLGRTPVVVTLPLIVHEGFPINTEGSVVKVYDYYENGGDQEATTTYDVTPSTQQICKSMPQHAKCTYL